MMREHSLTVLAVLMAAGMVTPYPAFAQLPLAPAARSGQSVTPAYEGWYRNPDGSFSLSFGYYNRNHEEVVAIPVGPANSLEGVSEQPQPTHFHPERHWGVFAVRVPADFGDKRVVGKLENRGESYAIPGSLDIRWQIDALEGEAGSGNTPPLLRFAGGEEGRGPAGVAVQGLQATVGVPLELTLWASDDGRSAGGVSGPRRVEAPVTLTWFVHRGPAAVPSGDDTPDVAAGDGKATTTVTFSAPGDYLLRVRANDASGVSSAGHAQCCWTNGFVKVNVTP